jgi:hypothetical protein
MRNPAKAGESFRLRTESPALAEACTCFSGQSEPRLPCVQKKKQHPAYKLSLPPLPQVSITRGTLRSNCGLHDPKFWKLFPSRLIPSIDGCGLRQPCRCNPRILKPTGCTAGRCISGCLEAYKRHSTCSSFESLPLNCSQECFGRGPSGRLTEGERGHLTLHGDSAGWRQTPGTVLGICTKLI